MSARHERATCGDGCREMPPTFGIPSDRFVAVIPGGIEAMIQAVEMAEDDDTRPSQQLTRCI